MGKISLFIMMVTLFASCGKSNTQTANETDTIVVNDPKSLLNVQTNSFSEIDSSGIFIFPLSMAESGRSTVDYSYKEIPYGYWNVIFYNSKTSEYHLLSDRKMIIEDVDAQYGDEPYTNSRSKEYIFFVVRTDDFNKDRKITDQDPRYLFISDKAGNNFKQISPVGYNLNTWQFVNASNTVILTAARDSDNNSKFNKSDEIAAFEVELDKESSARELFTAEFKSKLKQLYDRDWKRVKD